MAPWGGDWITHNPVLGRSNNPWNLDYTPGGSTGGGAAADVVGDAPVNPPTDRQFFRDWDVLLTPVTFTLAFRHSDAPPEVDRDDLTLTVNGQAFGGYQAPPA